MKKLYTLHFKQAFRFTAFWAIFIFLFSFGSEVIGENRYSVANGLWSESTTWSATSGGVSGASVPTTGDNVIIEGGFTVMYDTDNDAYDINVKATGTLVLLKNINFSLNGTANPPGIIVSGVLDCGVRNLMQKSGNSIFTLNSAATLKIKNSLGITEIGPWGCIQTAGVRTYSLGANYVYNGSANQETGFGLPANLTGKITISNTGSAGNNIVALNKSLAIGVGGSIEINSPFEVPKNISFVNNGSMTIYSTYNKPGSMIVKGFYSGGANCRFYRTMNKTRWNIISSPVSSSLSTFQSDNAIETADGEYNLAEYDENLDDWNYYNSTELAGAGNFIAGKGYLTRFPIDGQKKFFSGMLSTANVACNLSFTNVDNGWNCVGNPYASAIRITDDGNDETLEFLTNSAVTSKLAAEYTAIYVWNESDAGYTGESTEDYYRVINNSGYNINPPVFEGNDYNYVQPGQGFLIKVKEGGNVPAFFTTGMQYHQAFVPLKSASNTWSGITLNAESKGKSRSTVIAFNKNMTTGLDVSFDAGLLSSDNFQLYTQLIKDENDVDFAIQCLPDNQYSELIVPVGVDLPDGGELVFKASGIILPDGLCPILEDKELNIKTPLKSETDSYSVILAPNTKGIGRFYLSVGDITLAKPEFQQEIKYSASFKNNRITINGTVEAGTKALLFDVNGRKLGEYLMKNLNHNEISVSGFNQQIIILKIEAKKFTQAIKLCATKY